jgi:hypothetical protein
MLNGTFRNLTLVHHKYACFIVYATNPSSAFPTTNDTIPLNHSNVLLRQQVFHCLIRALKMRNFIFRHRCAGSSGKRTTRALAAHKVARKISLRNCVIYDVVMKIHCLECPAIIIVPNLSKTYTNSMRGANED